MNIQSDIMHPVTPAQSMGRYWRSEDSGYHTSYTPGTLELSEISSENIDPYNIKDFTADILESTAKKTYARKYRRFKSTPIAPKCESILQSPKRKGIKRPYVEDDQYNDSFYMTQTPTSVIAGGIQRLRVDEIETSPSLYQSEFLHLSYPTTPIKKVCFNTNVTTSSCIEDSLLSSPLRAINNLVCPPRRSAKKLSFSNNLLPGETQEVKRVPPKAARTIFKPEKKVDIVEALYKQGQLPAITKILSYLSNKDVYNFSQVSPTWLQVCENETEAKVRKCEFMHFINDTKENHENRKVNFSVEEHDKANTKVKDQGSSLKDIHNIVSQMQVTKTPKKSPPTTPRTMKFKRFTKMASIDSRSQLSCIRCKQPAKVTEEASGEEWAECFSSSCAMQFCKYCLCPRHTGKSCIKYDIDGPSPSKRKKNTSVVGSKISKKNLRRFL